MRIVHSGLYGWRVWLGTFRQHSCHSQTTSRSRGTHMLWFGLCGSSVNLLYGNTWPLSTISIESRNARIKRYGLRFTSWRPHVTGTTTYLYVNRRSGEHVTSQRGYTSSAAHQLLKRVALAEKSWHSNHRFRMPDKIRLQLQLRSTLIKVEVADAPPSLPPATTCSLNSLALRLKNANFVLLYLVSLGGGIGLVYIRPRGD